MSPKKPDVSKQTALQIVEFARAKQANNPVILDVSAVSGVCDYFVICSGETGNQVRAIRDAVVKECRNHKIKVHHVEDDQLSRWLLVDCFSVILHIFNDESREFYNLEYLYNTAARVRITRQKKSEKT